jgi:hypothetical protein
VAQRLDSLAVAARHASSFSAADNATVCSRAQDQNSRASYQALLKEVGGTPDAKRRRARERLRWRLRSSRQADLRGVIRAHEPHEAISGARREFSPNSRGSEGSAHLGSLSHTISMSLLLF